MELYFIEFLKIEGYKEEEIVVISVNENTEETQTKPKGT